MGQDGMEWVAGRLHCDDFSMSVLGWKREYIPGDASRVELLTPKKLGRYPESR